MEFLRRRRRHMLSPLIYLIFITFINSCLSRHHIRHHRDRFKRQQGALLYLAGSYVYDGGEGGPDIGPWTDWSSPSACSRTCGGGVSSQYRQCQDGYSCQGSKSRHFSCNTQDCPDTGDFRAQQCSEFDSIPFESVLYQWIPYTKAPNPCELNCMPRGERFYYRHKAQVIDGTRCNDESLDVCVAGKCQPVGCDMMLGSPTREDRCRRCGGDGSACNTITGRLDMQDLQVGYNDILLIPPGATNINVQEISPSNNYLAVRNTSGHYYLNGNWRIDFPKTIEFSGCKFHYERSPQGFSAPDKISCLGPTDEALFIVLLYQDRNVGVDYEYSVPTNIQVSSQDETYAWTFDQFTPCTVTCGGGTQHRNVTCAGRKSLEPVDRSLCDSGNEPATSQRCGETPCDAQWVPHLWSECSAPCGANGGVQTRQVTCQQVVSNGYSTIVNDENCAQLPMPPLEQACNQGTICAEWFLGPWKPCDHICGEGRKTRQVKCYRKVDGKIEDLPESECPSPRPEQVQRCNLRPCEGVDWITSEWSGCDLCGLTNETRNVQCATAEGQIYDEQLCDTDKKPEIVRECDTSNISCEYLWYASQWSECSAKCGEGVQTRTIFCGTIGKDKQVIQVSKDKCDPSKTYDTIKPCSVEKECPGEWYSGPWTECSKPCGGGERTKKVICLKNLQVVGPDECGADKIVFSQEECNIKPCSEDTILPTDITKSIDESDSSTEPTSESTLSSEEIVDDDEYEITPDDECDDGEWIDQEDVSNPTTETSPSSDSMSLDDLMLSDSPSSGTDTEVTGSGDFSLFSDFSDGSSTLEGSGDTTETLISTEASSFSTDSSSSSEISGMTEEFIISASSDTSNLISESTEMSTEDTSEKLISTQMTSINTDSSSESSNISTDMSSQSTGFPSDSSDELSTTENTSINSSDMSSMTTEMSSLASSENTEVSSENSSGSSSDSSSSSSISSESTSESTDTTQSSDLTSTVSTDSSDISSIITEISSTSDSEKSSETESTFSGESDIGSETQTSSEISESTTEMGSTTDVSSISTESFESSESSTEMSGSSTETSKSSQQDIESTTELTDNTTEKDTMSTTDFTGSTESTSEFTGSTVSTTEFTGSTESTSEFAGSTISTTEFTESTELTTEFTGSTESTMIETTSEYNIWSSTDSTTQISDITEVFLIGKQRMCKRKKLKDCKKTKYGCCIDKITPGEGPFNKGCPVPKTCNETRFGCCEDGVSIALGRKFKGCPSTLCNETLFGCCWDKTTPAEGQNEEGCPPKPPACLKSKYGCCENNITAAKGPKGEGCQLVGFELNCSQTIYGCCPDGVSAATGPYFNGCDIIKENCQESYWRCCPDGVTSASGPNYRGCDVPCAESTFGCCPDGATSAHGYNGEGCCLHSAFGCCPDNILPARGSNLEGCSCQYSPYGCCPDNVTIAKGYNKEGCGCKFSEFGCCPDDNTTASGMNYEGCSCHTYQFDCCPDGINPAKGPHQQGCGCRYTEFGCCSDDKTPAKGPEYSGCDCASSKYGCCLDGVSQATGENFEGCEETPINHQESCTLSKERGSCRNYTVKWFFDMDYGGCSRFWYGGCEGNGNRFKSKEECDDTCVKPEGTDRCNLPKVPGPCEGYYPQWFYDKERRHCAQFVYGGCLGNNNKFETREECQELCVKDSSSDVCEQLKDEGPCRGTYLRWYFDKDQKQCLQFHYGGCKGNSNNYLTEEACKYQCGRSDKKKDHCNLPKMQGNCTGQESRWYFDNSEKRCMPFYYTNCGGNENNFVSLEACETDCPNEIEKDLCHLAAEVGSCANYVERWYYDTSEKDCRQFYYGGCDGNENNFETQQACQAICKTQTPDSQEFQPEVQPQPQPQPQIPSQSSFQVEYCFLPSSTDNCGSESQVRFYYDSSDGSCKPFSYNCGGNSNNFGTLEECQQYCSNAQDICDLPPVAGSCQGTYQYFYYDSRSDRCVPFVYGGCGGNYNRFETEEDCNNRCQKSPDKSIPSLCQQSVDPGNCSDSQSAFFFESATSTCTPFTYSGCGGNTNRFSSEEQCERQCGQFIGHNPCNLPRDPGPCRSYFAKFYYDQSTGRCGQFAYGGCQGNANRFSSNEECEQICMTHEERKPNVTSTEICRLSVDRGSCQDGYHKRWYFDNERGECLAFIYSGCGGNFNNFKTFQSCIEFCHDLIVTESPLDPSFNSIEPHPCQALFDECATLRCAYGLQAYVDENNCNRCQCHDPCSNVNCPSETQCAIDINRNRTTNQDPNFVAVCREANKKGICPSLQLTNNCEEECRNDADCALELKCCSNGCGTSCVSPQYEVPAELVTQAYLPAFTDEPIQSGYAPPVIDTEVYKPQVEGLIGDQAILNCAIKGNPNPKITWSKDNLLIDGTQPRYRIKLDQTLQIITLHKTDTGIYLCTADNSIGEPVTNHIKLEVIDSEPRPATVLVDNEIDPNVIVSLNAPTILNCLVLGYPFPAVTWWKNDTLIPLMTNQFEVRKDHSLLIHSVQLHDLGVYTCQAYNGFGKATSWSVTVQAKGPYYTTNSEDEKYLRYIINPPQSNEPRPPHLPQPYYPPPITYTEPDPEIVPNNEVEPFPNIVPVQTNITLNNDRFPVGSEIVIPCIVIGNPAPQVQWYKDGVPLQSNNNLQISEDNRLTIPSATKADSGVYQCEAANYYSKSSNTVTISVDGMYIHPNCKDNRFLANCALIVKARYCAHKYYARFCCRSCTEAGLLPVDGPHLYGYDKKKISSLVSNLV